MEYTNKNCYIKDSCKIKDKCEFVNEQCVRFLKIDYLFNQSLLPINQRTKKCLSIDDDGTDQNEFERLLHIQKNIVDFIDNGNNIYLYSSIPGNGKTSWAIRLMQSYIYNIWPESQLTCRALFINVPKFLLELKSNISKKSEYIEFIQNNVLLADIVVWDDIATKVATEFEHEHLLNIIDNRFIENKSNIFTSNISPERLPELLNGRLASRIIGCSENIEFKGKDKRGVIVE